jgi:biofilm protein TabA
MISGDITHFNRMDAELSPLLFGILKTIITADFGNIEDGEILKSESDVRIILFNAMTDLVENRKAESHFINVDVHYVVEGKEVIYHLPLRDALTVTESNPDADIRFHDTRTATLSSVALTAGGFAVFYPSDIHVPLCTTDSPARVRKVVAKIPINLVTEARLSDA